MSVEQDQDPVIDNPSAAADDGNDAGADYDYEGDGSDAGDPDAGSADGAEVAAEGSASSTAEPSAVSKNEGILKKVLKSLGVTKDDPAEKPATAEKPDNSQNNPAEADDGKPGADEKPSVPAEIAAHPAYKAMEEENQALKSEAVAFRGIQDFAVKTNMGPEFFQVGLQAAGLAAQGGVAPEDYMRGAQLSVLAVKDPAAFYKELCEMADTYGQFLGERLPSDLQAEVDGGTLELDRAKEIVKSRFTTQAHEQQNKRLTQDQQRQAARHQGENNANLVKDWAASKAKDPNFKNKVEAVEGEFLRLTARVKPANPAQIVQALDQALANVNKRFSATRNPGPGRRADPAGSSGRSAAGSGAPQSKNEKLLSKILVNLKNSAG